MIMMINNKYQQMKIYRKKAEKMLNKIYLYPIKMHYNLMERQTVQNSYKKKRVTLIIQSAQMTLNNKREFPSNKVV